tara:strand:+ start:45 stop:329 length:285 start_codon:yes stop_codon:yes gene_type:complete
MQEILQPTLIEKELIPDLNFKKTLEFEQSPALKEKLVEATRLGNSYKGKMRIEFVDDSGFKAVETTIWATGAKFICLKGGVWLPISRIKNISMM